MTKARPQKTTSTGQMLADIDRLQLHYRAKEAEYEATLRSVGLQKGWSVLDAGCGAGNFLPLMAELVGQNGHISALDLTPENIEYVKSLVTELEFLCPIESRTGSVLSLPYEDNTFDAVWSANVVQYLTEEEMRQCLSEAYRVIRPEGLIAVKEVDVSIFQFRPLDPVLVWHLLEAGRSHITQIEGFFRGTRLPTWLREAGFINIKPETTIYERWHPLSPTETEYIGSNLNFLASLAEKVDVAEREKEIWREIGKAPEQLMEHPDFCYRSMHVLAVGQKPVV